MLHKDSDIDTAIARLEKCLELARSTDVDGSGSRNFNHGSLAAKKVFLYLTRFDQSHHVGDLIIAQEDIKAAEGLMPVEDTMRKTVDMMKILIRRNFYRAEKGVDLQEA
ncbi:hypothetical protein TWF481_001381 [Arthrobotrys musiformis]|uniref:HEPN domain-containing protein n=1 Tax=Arthrobotrys musiformis TaxID=47236 RepID=A0AAV9WQE4_9PEZI